MPCSEKSISSSTQLKLGSLLSYASMFLSIVIGLVYTPVMIRILGQNEHGLYSTVSSTISMLSVLHLGFNSSYVRYFARYRHDNDEPAIARLNGLFIIIFTILGAVALVCGLFLSFNLQLVFDRGLTADEYVIARILMLMLTVNISVSFPMGVFGNIISANERFIFLKLVGMIRTVVSPVLTIVVLKLGGRSIGMVAVTMLLSLITDIVYIYYVFVRLRNRFVFHDFEKGLLSSLFAYTTFIAINSVVDQINWNIDKILLGRYVGTAAVSVYAIGSVLYSYYMSFSTAISGVFTPRVHGIVQRWQNDSTTLGQELTELFIKVGRVQFLLLGLIASGLVLFGKQFIALWVGSGYEDSYYIMLLLVLPASIALIQNLGIEIQRAENRHQFRSIAYAIMALLNLVLSIFLCQKYGGIGAAIGTAISLIVANGFVMNVYYQKRCHLNIPRFWKNILRLSVGLVIPAVCGWAITRFHKFNTFPKLIVGIVLYTAIYCASMWFLAMNDYEKNLVREPVKRILKRLNHD